MRGSAQVSTTVESEFDRFVEAADDRELEIKFETDAKGLRLARQTVAATPASQPRTLRSVYFDTAAGDLWRRRIVLRVRRDRRRYIMGLKWTTPRDEGLFARGEIEVPSPGPAPDIARFDAAIADQLLDITGGRPLEAQFETRVKRYVRTHEIGRSVVDVALDEGFVVAGARRAPLRELELELKSGDDAALYDLAMRLADSLPLRLATMSKAERGFLLSGGAEPAPVRAGDIKLAADTTLDEAIGSILSAGLGHFGSNLSLLEVSRDPEIIHQMRVALRRLRSALRAFEAAVPCADFALFRAEAKSIASELGAARNWDVFVDLVESGPLGSFARDASFDALLGAAEERRGAAYAAAREAIAAARTTRFLINLQSFLVRRAWRNALPGGDLPRLTAPAKAFAAAALERLHRRALKRGKKLLALPRAERHRVRIALKNLRYTAEFLGGLFDGDRTTKDYVHAIARLQDTLGAANDVTTIEHLLTELPECSGGAARAAGIMLGWYGRGSALAEEALRRDWKAFKQARPFWQ